MITSEYRRLVNRVHWLLPRALKLGKIVRGCCAVCGIAPAEGHHTDYREPLVVVWLCKKHHKHEHKGKSRSYQWLGKESFEPRPEQFGASQKQRTR